MSLQTINIGRFYTGGEVGSHPTILIGTLFVEDIGLLYDTGTFRIEAGKVQENIEINTRNCRKIGMPVIINLFTKTEEAFSKQIEFVIAKTDFPFLISGSKQSTRLAGLEIVTNLRALDRAVYQSISVDSSDNELQWLANNQPSAIMVKLGNLKNHTVDDALKKVDQIKARLPLNLHSRLLLWIDFVDEVSIKRFCEMGQHLRKMTGHPIVGSPFTGIHSWQKLKIKGQAEYVSALASTIGFCTAFGFDFLFIGPLRHLTNLSTAQGVVDIYNRYNLIDKNSEDFLSENHPIHELL